MPTPSTSPAASPPWSATSGAATRSSGHKNVYYRGARGEFAYWYRGVHASPETSGRSLAGRDVLTIPHHTKFGSPTDWRLPRRPPPAPGGDLLPVGRLRSGRPAQRPGRPGHGPPPRLRRRDELPLRPRQPGQLPRERRQRPGLRHCPPSSPAMPSGRPSTTATATPPPATASCSTSASPLEGRSDRSYPMGTDLRVDLGATGPRRFTLRVAGTHHLDAVELLRNNRVVFAARPGGRGLAAATGRTRDPLGAAGADAHLRRRPPLRLLLPARPPANRQLAWSSPIWLTQAPASAGAA